MSSTTEPAQSCALDTDQALGWVAGTEQVGMLRGHKMSVACGQPLEAGKGQATALPSSLWKDPSPADPVWICDLQNQKTALCCFTHCHLLWPFVAAAGNYMSRPVASPAAPMTSVPQLQRPELATLVAGSCLSCWTRASNPENVSPQSGGMDATKP